MFNLKQAKLLQKRNNINSNVVKPSIFKKGLNIELEHKNITHGNPELTAKIAIAHLKEDPKYYYKLSKQEAKAEKYYKRHKKPNIFK